MQGRPGAWENELLVAYVLPEMLVAYVLPSGHVAAHSVPLIDGAFVWAGKVYRWPHERG